MIWLVMALVVLKNRIAEHNSELMKEA